jgi:hypothetical protein
MDEQSPRSEFMDFVRSVQQSIKKMTTMEIKTIVGDFALGADEEVTTLGGDYKVMESQFNLLLGDVTVKIDQELLGPEFEWVRNFHAQKEQQGHQIIQNNINLLLTLINLYRQTFKEQQAAGYVGGGTVVNQPLIGSPVVDQPIIGNPIVNQPVIGNPIVNQPLIGGTLPSEVPVVVADPTDAIVPSPLTSVPASDASPIVNMPTDNASPIVNLPADGTNPPPATDVFGNPIGTVPGQ